MPTVSHSRYTQLLFALLLLIAPLLTVRPVQAHQAPIEVEGDGRAQRLTTSLSLQPKSESFSAGLTHVEVEMR